MKGCKAASHTWNARAAGITWYRFQMNINYCWNTSWPGGPVKPKSTIYNVAGVSLTDSNLTSQVQNAVGPAGINRVPVMSGRIMPDGYLVYGWFQHRACLGSGVVPICTKWEWTRVTARLGAGGTVTWGN